MDIDEQPRKRISNNDRNTRKQRTRKCPTLDLHNLLWHRGLHISRRLNQVLDNLVALLLAGSLDLLELLLGLLVGIFLGLLESARVLQSVTRLVR